MALPVGIKKSQQIVLLLVGFFLCACEQDQAAEAETEPKPDTPQPVVKAPVNPANPLVFPEGESELLLGVQPGKSPAEIILPYTEGLIPRVGDTAELEVYREGEWLSVAKAHVAKVTSGEIILRKYSGESQLAERAKIRGQAIHRCDISAASPLDKFAVVKGVETPDLELIAIEHCNQAVSRYPQTPRFQFQLARVLDVHHQAIPAIARYRYTLALEPEYAAAYLALAGKYMEGEGVVRDLQEARHLLRQAHMRGLTRATYLLGQLIATGDAEHEADPETAFGYFMTASLGGDMHAQLRLAAMYESGTGVAQDRHEALEWYERTAASGHVESQVRLARAYAQGLGREQNWEKAFEWWRRAALQQLPEAQVELGKLYEAGQGLETPQLSKAIYWYRQAADQDDAEGQFHLGRMYALGLGVQKDEAVARPLLQAALEQGIAAARKYLFDEPEVLEQVAKQDASPGGSLPGRPADIQSIRKWRVKTQGFMDHECLEALIDELDDLEIDVVAASSAADARLLITMNNPEYYSSSMGPLRFTGFNIQYRAEVIRLQDNIRLFYTHGQEDGDSKTESCVDALDEIMDDLEDELD